MLSSRSVRPHPMSDWFGEGRGVLRVDWLPSRSPPSLPCRPALARSKSRSGAHPRGSWHGITRDRSLEIFLMSVQKSMRIRLLFQQGVSGSAAGRPASGGGTSPCRGDTPSGGGGDSHRPPSTASPIKRMYPCLLEKAFLRHCRQSGCMTGTVTSEGMWDGESTCPLKDHGHPESLRSSGV